MRVGQVHQDRAERSLPPRSEETSAEERAQEGSLTFREVTFHEVGRVADPHYHRARAFVVWVTGPSLGGIFATAPQRLPDLEMAITLYARLFSAPQTRALFSDARAFGVERLVFDAMLHDTPRMLGGLEIGSARGAIVLPEGWSRAWWVGAIAMKVVTPMPTRVFSDQREAWDWLGGTDEELAAVQQLTATLSTHSEVRTALEDALRADPSLTIARAAALLGSSARSLQRALSATHETFADLKARARADLAIARLVETDDKIDAVATFAGFRSRSHFVSWFRRTTGKSPGDFRESRKPKDL